MLSDTMLSDIMLSDIMLSGIMLNVVVLSSEQRNDKLIFLFIEKSISAF
jgi:hypothetical protein